MIGLYDTEFIGLKKSSCGVILECGFLLFFVEHEEIDCYHLKVNYNMFEHDKGLWSNTLRHMNRLGFYIRVITVCTKSGKELSTLLEEVREICNFWN